MQTNARNKKLSNRLLAARNRLQRKHRDFARFLHDSWDDDVKRFNRLAIDGDFEF